MITTQFDDSTYFAEHERRFDVRLKELLAEAQAEDPGFRDYSRVADQFRRYGEFLENEPFAAALPYRWHTMSADAESDPLLIGEPLPTGETRARRATAAKKAPAAKKLTVAKPTAAKKMTVATKSTAARKTTTRANGKLLEKS